MLTSPKSLFALATAMAVLAACAPATTPPPTPTLPPPSPTPLPPTTAPTATAALRPTPSGESLFPKVTADDWQLGPADARITIIEYGDYQ
ncbi:MAG: hypothetical protein RMK99_05375 [Anaerolineales bacterium]|nr:hypothetical protein [Anaerolineales bacterium]